MKARALQSHMTDLLDRADRTADFLTAAISAIEAMYADDEDPPEEYGSAIEQLQNARDLFDEFEEPAD